MQIDEEIKQIFDNLRKIAFYVGHGKYNDYMTTDEVLKIKAKLEKILDIEKVYEKAELNEEKVIIHKRLLKYQTFSIKDFIDYKIEDI